MEIISEILNDPVRRIRLGELLGQAVACKKRIASQRETIQDLRRSARYDLQLNPKDFNAEVKKYT